MNTYTQYMKVISSEDSLIDFQFRVVLKEEENPIIKIKVGFSNGLTINGLIIPSIFKTLGYAIEKFLQLKSSKGFFTINNNSVVCDRFEDACGLIKFFILLLDDSLLQKWEKESLKYLDS